MRTIHYIKKGAQATVNLDAFPDREQHPVARSQDYIVVSLPPRRQCHYEFFSAITGVLAGPVQWPSDFPRCQFRGSFMALVVHLLLHFEASS